MKSLYYENLRDSKLTRMEQYISGRLKVFREYLGITKKHLMDQTLEVSWDMGSKALDLIDTPNSGEWISVFKQGQDLSDSELRTLFEGEGVDELFELLPDKTRTTINYAKDNLLKVIFRDRDSEQLLVDRIPFEGSTLVVRPNTYVIQKQLNAIKQLQDKPAQDHEPLLRLFDRVEKTDWPGFKPSGNNYDWQFLTDEQRPGTIEQRSFVRQAMDTLDFAFLEGPPGSGKTTAICELIAQAVKKEQRVLLCASTHVAIDNVIERLMVDGNNAADIIPVRIGNDGNISDHVRQYTLKNFKDNEEKRIRKYINGLHQPSDIQREWVRVLSQTSKGNDELQTIILESANLICGTTIGILQHPEIKKNSDQQRNEPTYDLLIIDEASKTTFQEFLVPALLTKKWILVGDPQQLSPYVDADELSANLAQLLTQEERDAALDVYGATQLGKDYRCAIIEVDQRNKLKTADLYREYAKDKEILVCDSEDQALEFADIVILTAEEIISNLHRLPLDVATLRYSNNEWLKNQIKTWFQKKHEIEPRWEDQIAWRILREYEQRFNSRTKTAETLRRVIHNLIPEPKRNELSKDIEGLSRIALPSVLECLQKGISRDKNPKGGEFQGTFLTDGFPDYALAPRYTLLKFQHRMHPEISAFSREHLYHGDALNDPLELESERELNPPLWYQHRSQWLHVGEGYTKSNVNEKEVAIIIGELKKLSEWKQHSITPVKTVALLTFYRGQEKSLRSSLRRLTNQNNGFRHFHYKGLAIDLCTVDRFQGHEADIVYLSFVNRRSTNFLESPNRLNVALTRARFQLVLVGNRKELAGKDDESLLSKLCKVHENKTDLFYGGRHE